MTFAELRAKHPRFHYRRFRWQQHDDSLRIEFDFLLEPDVVFTPRIEIAPITAQAVARAGSAELDRWVFHLGLIELFSYWKAAAPAEIVVSAGTLSPAQQDWWKELLLRGMGEFFYVNNIDFTAPDFVRFLQETPPDGEPLVNQFSVSSPSAGQPSAGQSSASQSAAESTAAPRYLVPVGGGKDSALVLELLEENGLSYDVLLSFPQSPAAQQIAQLSRAENIITLKREFDPQLFALNRQGYLNGHTPFSARLAFESSLTGLLSGHTHILLGNEFSANEGNVLFHGVTVNHQYSKTFEFEQAFRQYVQEYLRPAPEYLSLLRPVSELQIAGIFSQYPRFHPIFKSCNRNQQEGTWCCDCSKCLFVFTVLSPFLGEDGLVGPIFPENLFEKESLQPAAIALLGKDEHKPFECVGTYEETLAAFVLSIQQFRRTHPDAELPPVLRYLSETVLADAPENTADYQAALCFWNPNHNLDRGLEAVIKGAQQRLCEQQNLG